MKPITQISIGLNIVLLLCLTGGFFYFLYYSFRTQSELDARPKGSILTLPKEQKIISGDSIITLPSGTILQESTPQGAATLGKIPHREYVLVISTKDFNFSTNSPSTKLDTWMNPYQLTQPSLE